MTPPQKPGRSKQDYGTPPEFLEAVKRRLGIKRFDCDLAASKENAVAHPFFTAEFSALQPDCSWKIGCGWNWLNPPYADIEPWVKRACQEYESRNVRTAVLIPASVGSNWWREWVHLRATVLFLNGRITFVGCEDPYPKDCALLLYAYQSYMPNYSIWTWKPSEEQAPDAVSTAGAEILSSE